MIGVWVTNHEISHTVGKAIFDSLKPIFPDTELCRTVPKEHLKEVADINIGYGILRDMDAVWHKAASESKPYFVIDRGYWKPNHYDGYYRISLNGTQQTTGLDRLEPDYERWKQLGLEILPSSKRGLFPLVCKPTASVEAFFQSPYFPDRHSWWERKRFTNIDLVGHYIDRPKDCGRPLQSDLDRCSKVITFNSSVGWEALRQGIPCISDENHSFVGAYQKQFDISPHLDVDSRRRFFAVQAGLQLTLEEIRSGKIWPLIQRLMSLSGSIVVKP